MTSKPPVRSYGKKAELDVTALRTVWQQLAATYAGTSDGLRFKALLDGIAGWDGELLPPVSIALAKMP